MKHRSPPGMAILRIAFSIVILGLGVFVALSPKVTYAPAPKIVLYCLISFLPAILFGSEAASRFQLKLRGFMFTTAGAAALSLGTLLLLTQLSKPEQQIGVFHIVDENREPVNNLDRAGAVEVPITDQGLTITKFVDGNTVVLIFPEQVGECELRIKPLSFGKTYLGSVTYSGNRESTLVFGRQLKAN